MMNLRDRLNVIREIKKASRPAEVKEINTAVFSVPGWQPCGAFSVKREISVKLNYTLPDTLPVSLPVLVPDLRYRSLPSINDFLFFDLETTGLSGGAGTIAFLAAFGRFSEGSIRITQYLLLDYPGEREFLDAVLKEFNDPNSVIVSYNGKTFDSNILRTRCLMNGIQTPGYCHTDLLHPARRLWKTILPNCSQAVIETDILGLDRSGDIPGVLAPEIWFEFLKTGGTKRLSGICDHNKADICGLAAILNKIILIAQDPLQESLRYDIEKLALYWRGFIRHSDEILYGGTFVQIQNSGKRLLHYAAGKKYPVAVFFCALDELHCGNSRKGREALIDINRQNYPDAVKGRALRALAIDSERRLNDIDGAIMFTRRGLALQTIDDFLRADFEKRALRLEKKL
ncbi:MAG: ribonuclease H-like domain-containing protein [Treponema sp.]|jgi:uncharacterized protein YprB with RNaseH-like and TPR domain|nr:ribonuclease H-like domain-containing protein [Treponema sp.]